MTQQKTKYPSAVYAAAGVGDLVYEQLRKLQTKAIAFGNERAPQWKRRVADMSVKVDAGKVRESVVTGTHAAAEKATKVYGTLVARGEKAFAEAKPAPAVPALKTDAAARSAGASAAAKADTSVAAKAGKPADAKAGTPADAKAGTPADAKAGTPADAKADTKAVAKADTKAVAAKADTADAMKAVAKKAGGPVAKKAVAAPRNQAA